MQSAETDKFFADEVITTAVITGDGPTCDIPDVPAVGRLEPGETARQINLDTYCEGDDLRYEVRSDNPAVASVRLRGSSLTVTADDAPRYDSTEIIVTATDRGGRGESTEVRFDVLVERLEPPEVRSVNCSPSVAEVDENVTCTASLRGGEPDPEDGWSWSGGEPSGPSDRETYRTSFSEPGPQRVVLTVSNLAGRDSGSTSVEVPPQPPEIIDVTCRPSSVNVGQNVTCTALLRGGEPDDYSWSDSDGGSGSSSEYRVSFSSPGEKTVRLTVSNSAGRDSALAEVTVEVERPEITVSCPSPADVDERITCTVDNDGGAIDTYEWSDSDGGSGSSASYRVSFSSSGTKTVSLTARNATGSDRDEAEVIVEGPPVISSDGIRCPSSADVDENITCTVRSSGGAIDTYSWSDSDGGSGSSSSYRTSFSTSGTKTVSLTVRNSAGSDSDSTTLTVPPDTQPPQVSISCSPSSVDTNENTSCSWSLTGGDQPTSWSWSDSDGGSGSSSSYSISFSSSGSKTVSLTVSNSAGSDTDSTSLTVQPEAPEINSISCNPSSPSVNQSVTCTASLSGGTPTSYSWSGGASNSSSMSYSTSFSSSGSKTVSLTVSNSAGSDSDSARVTVGVMPPDITVRCPSSADVDERITCTVRNNGGAIDTYSWTDSDGGSGNSSSYRVSFDSSGRKTVRLTATNQGGSNSDSDRVNVPVQPPEITVYCPSGARLTTQNIECIITNDGGAIDTYSWTDSDGGSGSSSSYRTSFNTSGRKTVRLTATNSAGSDRDSAGVTILAYPSSWFARCGSDPIDVYYFDWSGVPYKKYHLNITGPQASDIFGASWWNDIQRLTAAQCNDWPTGSAYGLADSRRVARERGYPR